MLSMALGAMLAAPLQPLLVMYEYCKPQRTPPFGPWYILCQNPRVPS